MSDKKLVAMPMKVRVERKTPTVRPITVGNGIVTETTWIHHLEVSGEYERNVVCASLRGTCDDSGGLLELVADFDDNKKHDAEKPYEVTVLYSCDNVHWVKHEIFAALDGLPILSHMGDPRLVL